MEKGIRYEILVQDLKKDYFKDEDAFMRLMRYYCSDLEDFEKKGNTKIVDDMYKKLNWNNEMYFDCIYSFWTIFSYGFIYLGKKKYYITECKNIKNVYKYSSFRNGSIPEKYINNNKEIIEDIVKLRRKFPELDFLSQRYHSISNFMPCPDSLFNSVKMLSGTGDFLCLIIDKIQKCIDLNKPLVYYYKNLPMNIDIPKLKEWKKYYFDNRENVFLTEEYEIIDDRLVGKKLFDTQSLKKPLPVEEREYIQCLRNIKLRLENRAKNMTK